MNNQQEFEKILNERLERQQQEREVKEIKKTNFFKKHWISILLVIAATLTTISILFIISKFTPELLSTHQSKVITKKKEVSYYSSLSGVKVTDQNQVNAPITAVMIENSPEARPQSGLASAEMVFEAVTEGGITRFAALYQNNKPTMIGPVRSVRTHFANLLTPFNTSIAHVGGSVSALALVRNGNYRDIDQMFNGNYYWRSNDRYAPHNVYTNFEKLDALNKSKNYTSSNPISFNRQDPKPAKENLVNQINVNFSSPLYSTYYTYNKEQNNYTRYLNGAIHKDREKGNITPNAIVVMLTTMAKIPGDKDEPQVVALGSGETYIFQNGTMIKGTWSKQSKESQIKLLDQNEKEIILNRGMTWFSLVTKELGSISWQ